LFESFIRFPEILMTDFITWDQFSKVQLKFKSNFRNKYTAA
jgi:hypothetical protein